MSDEDTQSQAEEASPNEPVDTAESGPESADAPEPSPAVEGETEVSRAADPPTQEALDEASRAIEAMVLVATDSVEDQVLAQVLELPVSTVRVLCQSLAQQYDEDDRGFQFVEVAGGWRFQTHPDLAPYIERYVLEGQTSRLSSAALETLAIVAYKQPISRGQISAIRGVNVDGVLRTLVQRGYVVEMGQDLGPGQAILFGTSKEFLERLGLASLGDLPSLGDFVPAAEIVEALEQTLRAENEAAIDLTDSSNPTDDPSTQSGDGVSASDEISGPDEDVEPIESAEADAGAS